LGDRERARRRRAASERESEQAREEGERASVVEIGSAAAARLKVKWSFPPLLLGQRPRCVLRKRRRAIRGDVPDRSSKRAAGEKRSEGFKTRGRFSLLVSPLLSIDDRRRRLPSERRRCLIIIIKLAVLSLSRSLFSRLSRAC